MSLMSFTLVQQPHKKFTTKFHVYSCLSILYYFIHIICISFLFTFLPTCMTIIIPMTLLTLRWLILFTWCSTIRLVHIWSSLSSKFCNGILWISSQLIFCLQQTLHNWRQTRMNDCKIPSCHGFVFQYAIIAFSIAQIKACCLEFDRWWSCITIFHNCNMLDDVFILMKSFEFWLKMFFICQQWL